MTNGDLLLMSNHPCDQPRCAPTRRINTASVIGMIVAAGLSALAWASTYSARPDSAYAGDPEAGAIVQDFDRSGTLSGLEIVF
jgi:hypothetical protein